MLRAVLTGTPKFAEVIKCQFTFAFKFLERNLLPEKILLSLPINKDVSALLYAPTVSVTAHH